MATTNQSGLNLAQASFLPPKKKATNKTLTPVDAGGTLNTGSKVDMPNFGFDGAGYNNAQQQGLMQYTGDMKLGAMDGDAVPGGNVSMPNFGFDGRGGSTGMQGITSVANKTTSAGQAPQEEWTGPGYVPETPINIPKNPYLGSESYDLDQNLSTSTSAGGYSAPDYQQVSGSAPKPEANMPQTQFDGNEYESNGYTGVQGNTEFTYDPRDESLVQNQITGLLDPESDLMRKAIALGNAQSASRGLQSSSIGSEIALSSMVDKALPIAQQDATTFANADQLGWQQSFTAEQNNLNREHDASMFDKQGQLQTDLQNNQFEFQNDQANADRQSQAELQELQYLQNLGMLDAQGLQRMQELAAEQNFNWDMQQNQNNYQMNLVDKQAQLQEDRDRLMYELEMGKIDKQYLQDLEKTKLEWEHDDAVFARNLNGQQALQYQTAVSDSYNKFLEQVALVYNNPNMTPEQQNAGVQTLRNMFLEQRAQLQAIYGFTKGDGDLWDGPDGTPASGPVMGSFPDTTKPIVNLPSTPGGNNTGGGGGGKPGGSNQIVREQK